MNVEIRGLSNLDELEDLYSFYPQVFEKTPIAFFKNRINNDPYIIPEDIRVAVENNRIISSVAVFKRNMYCKKSISSFAGIGNVSTHPEKRGLGLASAVLNDTLKHIDETGTDIVILFTGINEFYSKSGFNTIPGHNVVFNIIQDQYSRYNIRNFCQADLRAIQDIYQLFNKSLDGPIARDEKYWQANLSFADPEEIFLVAELNGNVEGYIRFVPGTRRYEIWEFGFTKREAFDALLTKASCILNKQILKTAALCPKQLLQSSEAIAVDYENTSIAMVCSRKGNTYKISEELINYCFWWTDNF